MESNHEKKARMEFIGWSEPADHSLPTVHSLHTDPATDPAPPAQPYRHRKASDWDDLSIYTDGLIQAERRQAE